MNLDELEGKARVNEELEIVTDELEDEIMKLKEESKQNLYEEIKNYLSDKGYEIDVDKKNQYRVTATKVGIEILIFTYASQDFKLTIRFNGKDKETIGILSDFDRIDSFTSADEKNSIIQRLKSNIQNIVISYELQYDNMMPPGTPLRKNIKEVVKEVFTK